jgi:hypothetical protein
MLPCSLAHLLTAAPPLQVLSFFWNMSMIAISVMMLASLRLCGLP